jgi:Zn-dependent protease with chaperone function
MATDPRWADLLGQLVVHSLVASLFLEALARGWRVRHPAQRMALRLVALGYPLVAFPALWVLFPRRLAPEFTEVALLSGRRWEEVPFFGVDLYRAFVVGLASLGALLFLSDLLAVVQALRRTRPAPATPDPESQSRIQAALAPLGARPGGAPAVVFLDQRTPVLFCRAGRRPTIHLSRGTLTLLDPEELAAALAHEAAHAERRDPERSWVMLVLRALHFVNPTFQVLARALARDAERLADERGVELGADRLALASSIVKMHRASGGQVARHTLVFGAALHRIRSLDVEQRARALLAPAPGRLRFGGLRLALAAATMTGLLYFVT